MDNKKKDIAPFMYLTKSPFVKIEENVDSIFIKSMIPRYYNRCFLFPKTATAIISDIVCDC